MMRLSLVMVLILTSVVAFLLMGPRPAASQQPAATSASDSGGYKVIGYFVQWGMYARNYRVKQVETTGSAAILTHINYAFANVSTESRCYEETRLGWGDSSADYLVGYSADQSVDGLPDDPNQKLKGHWNQLKKLKAMHPNLKVLISIGGFTWSGRFSDAALPQNREAFVESCIDLFIKGNLPLWAYVSGGTPSAGAENGRAAGVFDGIDIDWEYPAAPGFPGDPKRNIPPNVYRPEDTQNFTALLAEFRRQLDELGAKTGQHYLLTVAAPAGQENYSKIELDKIHPYLDWIDVMTYDMHGAWDVQGPTNFQAPLYSSPDDPARPPYNLSVDSVITAYLNKGVPPEKLIMGVPFYGRGWTGVPNVNNGLYQSADTMEPASARFEAGIEDTKILAQLGYPSFHDPKTKAMWIFDGKTWWNYDDPEVIAAKMTYIKQKKLGGVMFWSLDGDDGTLIRAIRDGLK
jgi:chitinase